MMFIPLFKATACHILDENKQAENTNWKTSIAVVFVLQY